MKITQTKSTGCLQIFPSIFKDDRGDYVETYNQKELEQLGPFVQDDFSTSRKYVMRGFHGDYVTNKLVHCIHGKIINIIVDLNLDSSSFGSWESFALGSYLHNMIFIPKGFGNLILSLQDNSVYCYKQNTYYEEGRQFTISYKDPTLNIPWNCWVDDIEELIVSERDKKGVTVEQHKKVLANIC